MLSVKREIFFFRATEMNWLQSFWRVTLEQFSRKLLRAREMEGDTSPRHSDEHEKEVVNLNVNKKLKNIIGKS